MTTEVLLYSPIAFVLYLVLVGALNGVGKILAPSGAQSALKTSTYGSGEMPPERIAAPGYSPFFTVALFFAVLHLGVLLLATGTLTPIVGLFLVGLIFALVALILG